MSSFWILNGMYMLQFHYHLYDYDYYDFHDYYDYNCDYCCDDYYDYDHIPFYSIPCIISSVPISLPQYAVTLFEIGVDLIIRTATSYV